MHTFTFTDNTLDETNCAWTAGASIYISQDQFSLPIATQAELQALGFVFIRSVSVARAEVSSYPRRIIVAAIPASLFPGLEANLGVSLLDAFGDYYPRLQDVNVLAQLTCGANIQVSRFVYL